MKRKRFTEEEIIGMRKESDAGAKNQSCVGSMGSASRHSTGGGVESGKGRNPTLSAGHGFLGHRYSPVRRI